MLEVELQRQLDLPRVEHRPRRPIQRVRRTLAIPAIRTVAEERGRIHRTEIRRAIDRIEKPNIGRVRKVEGFRDHFQTSLFPEGKGAPYSHVNRPEVVTNKRIARLDAD